VVEQRMTMNNIVLTTLDDASLLDAAKRLAGAERRATAALLRALMEIDSRRLYLGQGCASMFAYCTQVLHLAEGAAYNRIEAARAARSHPLILGLLEESAITLTAVRLLAPHLTTENHAAVLTAARYKSRREIEELIAALRPKPDAPAVVRKLPADRPAPAAAPLMSAAEVENDDGGGAVATRTPIGVERSRVAAPLAPDRYRLQLTVSRETYDTLRRAQALLRHAVPSGDAAEIVGRALLLLVEDLERRKAAQVRRPRAVQNSEGTSRQIPAAVRREVWTRDGARCAFVGAHGRCRETGFLEFHHVRPFAAGGKATVENIELRCSAHNAFEASLFFGNGGADVVREVPPAWGCASAHPSLDIWYHARSFRIPRPGHHGHTPNRCCPAAALSGPSRRNRCLHAPRAAETRCGSRRTAQSGGLAVDRLRAPVHARAVRVRRQEPSRNDHARARERRRSRSWGGPDPARLCPLVRRSGDHAAGGPEGGRARDHGRV
jgi:hypothetical protein